MNILWYAADALRYDYSKKKMPFLRKWSETAVTFENHFSVAHCSDPNFMSMLQGNYPWGERGHGIYTQLDIKKPFGAYPGIQHFLRMVYGHRCVGLGPAQPTFYLRGFDQWTPAGRKVKTLFQKTERGAMGVIKEFADQAKEQGHPWFAFIRTMDCHKPYYGGHYNRAVKYTDKIIANLFTWVERSHPDTIILLFSDHGEHLGEHGQSGHWATLYDLLLHTPMVMKWPGCPAGEHVYHYTRHVDMFPTMAELLQYPKFQQMEAELDGQSMLKWVGNLEPPVAPLMYFAGDGTFRKSLWNWRACRDGDFKYMAATHLHEAEFYLFNLKQDPLEQDNLAEKEEYRALLNNYARELAIVFPEWPRPDGSAEWEPHYNEEEAEIILSRLRQLGYA